MPRNDFETPIRADRKTALGAWISHRARLARGIVRLRSWIDLGRIVRGRRLWVGVFPDRCYHRLLGHGRCWRETCSSEERDPRAELGNGRCLAGCHSFSIPIVAVDSAYLQLVNELASEAQTATLAKLQLGTSTSYEPEQSNEVHRQELRIAE